MLDDKVGIAQRVVSNCVSYHFSLLDFISISLSFSSSLLLLLLLLSSSSYFVKLLSCPNVNPQVVRYYWFFFLILLSIALGWGSEQAAESYLVGSQVKSQHSETPSPATLDKHSSTEVLLHTLRAQMCCSMFSNAEAGIHPLFLRVINRFIFRYPRGKFSF